MRERWILETKKADFDGLSRELGMSSVAVRCMVNRGLTTREEMHHYLHGTLDNLHNPLLMKGMSEALAILQEALANREKVGIASDFDCDGIFAASVLAQGFETIGLACEIYTPDRVREGYGLNTRIIDEALEAGVSLLVTCDNGIAANEEVKYAKSVGMRVIVTDHHDIQGELPKADAVLDPKQEGETYPFAGLCGAGVAFKLICALYARCGIPQERVNELLDYVAIATVADVMELRDENRILVKYGLEELEKTSHIGLRAMLEVQELTGKKLNAGHIGFILGPCFNAAGRIATVEDSFALLKEADYDKALVKAQILKDINESRKEMTERGAEQAFEQLGNSVLDDILLLFLPDTHESLVGIIAGRVKERTGHPTIIFARADDGMIKGSGRSIEAYNMFENLLCCKDLMTRFGGHKMAAGMTLPEENLPELRRRLNEDSGLCEDDFRPVIHIDAPMPIGYATEQLLKEFEQMEPFGVGNPKPIFAEQHFRILRARLLGKEKNVLKLFVQNDAGNRIEAMMFHGHEEFEQFIVAEWGEVELKRMYEGKENDIDVAFTYFPMVNEYNGVRTIQIQIGSYCRVAR